MLFVKQVPSVYGRPLQKTQQRLTISRQRWILQSRLLRRHPSGLDIARDLAAGLQEPVQGLHTN